LLPCQGCALSSNVIKLQVDPASGSVDTSVVVRQPWLDVSGWALPQLPPLITDILLSLDDKWLFFSNWLRGEQRGRYALDQAREGGAGAAGISSFTWQPGRPGCGRVMCCLCSEQHSLHAFLSCYCILRRSSCLLQRRDT
jgi:hypothetical protein